MQERFTVDSLGKEDKSAQLGLLPNLVKNSIWDEKAGPVKVLKKQHMAGQDHKA
jgi:hypothetical protein